MFQAHHSRRSTTRRGAILLVVLTLLALFAVIGLSFALFAESEATASRVHREAADDSTPQDEFAIMDSYTVQSANQFATQLLYGSSDVHSGLYGHDLARSRFVSNLVTPSTTGSPVIPPLAGPQLNVFGGQGAINSSLEYKAAGLPAPVGQIPTALPGGAVVDRESVVNYTPASDAAGVYGIYPEFTGSYSMNPANGVTVPNLATGAPGAPSFISKAAAYTYPDANNFYLAQVRPDTGDLVTPSFHRDYVFGRRLLPGAPVTGNPLQLQYDTFGNTAVSVPRFGPFITLSNLLLLESLIHNEPSTLGPIANPNWFTRSGRMRIARPRPWDQLTPSEQSLVCSATVPAPIPFPIPESLSPNEAGALASAMQNLAQIGVIANIMPFPLPNPDGSVTGDVQNLKGITGTQKNDSVWIYPGGPVLNWRNKRVVAMVAPMILDLSSRANMNVAANFTEIRNTTPTNAPPQPIVTVASSRSAQGFGPHEINLSRIVGPDVLADTVSISNPTHPWVVSRNELRNLMTSRLSGIQPNTDKVGLSTRQPYNVNRGVHLSPQYALTDFDAGHSLVLFDSNLNTGPPSATRADRLFSDLVPTSSINPVEAPWGTPTPLPQPGTPGVDPLTFLSAGKLTTLPSGPLAFSRYAGFAAFQTSTTASMMFNPTQWFRNTGTTLGGPHQFGFEELRRLASRYGLGSIEAARAQSLSELGTLMPNTLGSPGTLATSTEGATPNLGVLARSMLTTYSTTMSRAQVAVPTWETNPLGNNPAVILTQARLGPIDVNRAMASFLRDPTQIPSPFFMIPAGVNPAQPGGNLYPDRMVYPQPGAPPHNAANAGVTPLYLEYARARQARQNLARDIFVRLASIARLPNVNTTNQTPTGYSNAPNVFPFIPNAPPGFAPLDDSLPLIDGIEVCIDPNTGYIVHFDAPNGGQNPVLPNQIPQLPNGQPGLPSGNGNGFVSLVPAAPGTPPGPGQISRVRFDALRQVAQIAANIVDYVDGDDLTTTFVWNPNNRQFLDGGSTAPAPFATPPNNLINWTPLGTIDGASTILNDPFQPGGPPRDALGNPATLRFVDPSADISNFVDPATVNAAAAPQNLDVSGLHVVYGTELPKVVINEAYCAVMNDPQDMGGGPSASRPLKTKFWIELHNTLPNDPTAPTVAGTDSPGTVRLRHTGRLYLPGPGAPTNPNPPTVVPGAYTPFQPYIVEVAELPTPGGAGTPPVPLVNILTSNPANVSGDLNGYIDVTNPNPPPPVPNIPIRIRDMSANPQPPYNLTNPPTALVPVNVPQPNPAALYQPPIPPGPPAYIYGSNPDDYCTIWPMGAEQYPTAPFYNAGFYVLGPKFLDTPPGGNKDALPGTTAGTPDIAVNSRPVENGTFPGEPLNELILVEGGQDQNTLTNAIRKQYAIALRRLADPYSPPNYPGMPASQGVFDPTRPINRYVTVDFIDQLKPSDRVTVLQGTGPHNAGPSGSQPAIGKRHPFGPANGTTPEPSATPTNPPTLLYGQAAQVAVPPGTPSLPPHTFHMPNDGNSGVTGVRNILDHNNSNPLQYTGDRLSAFHHPDRQLINPLELAHVSAYPPYLLGTRFFSTRDILTESTLLPAYTPARTTSISGNPANPAGPAYQGHSLLPWLTGRAIVNVPNSPVPGMVVLTSSAPQVTAAAGTPPVLTDLNPAGMTSLPVDLRDLYKALDLLTTKSRLTGVPVGGPEHGRINLNTIWDDLNDKYTSPPDAPGTGAPNPAPALPTTQPFTHYQKPLSSRMLKAILDPADMPLAQHPTPFGPFAPATTNGVFTPDFQSAGVPTVSVRRNLFDPTHVSYMWMPEPTVPVALGSSSNRMYRSLSFPRVGPNDVPFRSFASAQLADVPHGSKFRDTFLRQRPDGNGLFSNSPPPSYTVGADSIQQQHSTIGPAVPAYQPAQTPVPLNRSVAPTDGTQPAAVLEPLQKMLNSVSPTSDSFLVIMTVSYFEVRGMDTSIAPLPRPLIGQEAFRDIPGDLRKQFVMVVDRSALTVDNTFSQPGPRPWFSSLAEDCSAGAEWIVVKGVLEMQASGPPLPRVLVDGQLVPVPVFNPTLALPPRQDQLVRLGFGDLATTNPATLRPVDGHDGEWVVVAGNTSPTANPATWPAYDAIITPGLGGSAVPQELFKHLKPGEIALRVNKPAFWANLPNPPPANVTPGIVSNHAAGSPISNAIHGSPGPRPALLDILQPEARGVVPYFNDIPR